VVGLVDSTVRSISLRGLGYGALLDLDTSSLISKTGSLYLVGVAFGIEARLTSSQGFCTGLATIESLVSDAMVLLRVHIEEEVYVNQ